MIKYIKNKIPRSLKDKLRPTKHQLEDYLNEIKYRLNLKNINADLESFSQCHDFKSLYYFCEKHFPAVQNYPEIEPFIHFAHSKEVRLIAELGVCFGGTNFLLLESIASSQEIIGIDCSIKNKYKLKLFTSPGKKRSLLEGFTNASKIKEKFLEILGNRKLDLLLIDANHDWNGVCGDFLNYREYVKEGGIIAFHDIIDIKKTASGITTGRYVGDVPEFWKIIKDRYNSKEFVADYKQDGAGIGVIEYFSKIDISDLKNHSLSHKTKV